MIRAGSFLIAVLFAGALSACGDAQSEDDAGVPFTGGSQETPGTGGTGGIVASTASGGIEGGMGGANASGGAANGGSSTGSGGAVGASGGIDGGGVVGEGGTIDGGGVVGGGGTIGGGGIGSQGGRTGAGGAGNSGSMPQQGGATGSTTAVDLTCNTDDDCCVKVDTCRAIAVLYSKIQGLVYWPPATSTSCLRCVTPAVEVTCRSNQCVGSVVYPANGTSHCGKLPSTGTGGATTGSSAASVGIPRTPISDTAPQVVFGC